MYRKIIGFLEEWKNSGHRKPLILQGARQVGKTYSILEFGRTHYENVAYFNFETDPKLNETFAENISPDYLIPILSHIAGVSIVREKTLIVFDEVQLCERALTSLKYFCEEAPDYHIVVAGSLLGVAVNRAKFSFPVGKVDMKTLYPMDMEEFMLALGEDDLVKRIRQSFATDTPLPSALHDKAMLLYRQYLVVGGMPEAVTSWVATHNFERCRRIHNDIILTYEDDFNKYRRRISPELLRIVMHGVCHQTGCKLSFTKVSTDFRSAQIRSALRLLTLAGICTPVTMSSGNGVPPNERIRNGETVRLAPRAAQPSLGAASGTHRFVHRSAAPHRAAHRKAAAHQRNARACGAVVVFAGSGGL